MVITATFTASIADVWQLWGDPRLLERWWGPPGFPATFEHHDLAPGGTITYYISEPDGANRFGHRIIGRNSGHSRLRRSREKPAGGGRKEVAQTSEVQDVRVKYSDHWTITTDHHEVRNRRFSTAPGLGLPRQAHQLLSVGALAGCRGTATRQRAATDLVPQPAARQHLRRAPSRRSEPCG